jgi:dTDP-4-amino-4,6-dideoxygalactose transaminase
MTNVVKPYLPPLEEYQAYLKGIWDRSWLTNHGPLVDELETRLKVYLGVKHVIFVASGTVALQIIIKALELDGEILTTSFSHVAAVNALLLANCKPVFADIEKSSFCIDADALESLVTSSTRAILATHVFGYPCDVKLINSISEKHNLKTIYDGAHAFGVKINGQSIFNYGDVSAVSFHATKIFHTIEGGAIITANDALAEKCTLLRNFGLSNTEPFLAGINGKNSEFHAAMGLCNLPMVDRFIQKRRELSFRYRVLFEGAHLEFPEHPYHTSYNYAYFPVLFPSEQKLLQVKEALLAEGISARRYFHPSLNDLPYYKGSTCLMAEEKSPRVLCLPLYYDLGLVEVEKIATLIMKQLL